MDKNIDPKNLFDSMNKGLGKFYQEAKESHNSMESLLKKEIDELNALRAEGRRYVRPQIHAEGGMKIIIRANDRLTRRQVAIAKMKEEKLTIDSLKLFMHEARVLARLDHPNIVPLYDIGLDVGGEPYFTMKLLSGETLDDILTKLSKNKAEYLEKYTMHKLLEIFLKGCEAVAFAHSRNVIHRDLKPANIQVSDFGEVLLCDWGLAKDVNLPLQSTEEVHLNEIFAQQTIHGIIKGTPGYMAPEQIDIEKGEMNEKTDIYALGCILYGLLTHCEPIDSDSVEILKHKTVLGDVIPPSLRSSRNIPKALEAVVIKAMSVNPHDRYNDVNEIINEVRSFINGYATKAQNADFSTQFILFLKRHKVISFSLLFSLIVISGLIVFFILHLNKRNFTNTKTDTNNSPDNFFEQRLTNELAPDLFQKSQEALIEYDFIKALKNLRYAVAISPSSKEYLSQLGRLEFAQHNFFNAATIFSKLKDDSKYATLYELAVNAEKDESFTPNKIILTLINLSELKLAELFTAQLNRQNSNAKKIETISEIYQKLQAPAPLLNPTLTTLSFPKVDNSKINHLNYFAFFPLIEIDISNSNITDIQAVQTLPLKKLNIAFTNINDFSPILKLSDLEKLIISENQYLDKQISQYLKLHNVTIEILSK